MIALRHAARSCNGAWNTWETKRLAWILLRKSFWKGEQYKPLKLRLYNWASQLYICMLYGGKPIPGHLKLFHGLNQNFLLDEFVPIYFGPFSTSAQINVAKSFSEMKGQIWFIKSANGKRRARFVLAIAVSWLSKYVNEDEWLLFNTPLPISDTKTFMDKEQDLEKRIDWFLSQLRNAKHKISERHAFLRRTGVFTAKEIDEQIVNEPLLLNKYI